MLYVALLHCLLWHKAFVFSGGRVENCVEYKEPTVSLARTATIAMVQPIDHQEASMSSLFYAAAAPRCADVGGTNFMAGVGGVG